MSKAAELTDAITKHDVDQVNRLLDDHPELVTQSTESGISFVMHAFYCGALNIVRTLTTRGAVWTVADAVAADDIELLASQISASSTSVSAYTVDGWTPLHLAAHFGNEAAVTTLVSHHADVNAWSKNNHANQPLHAGCAGEANDVIVKTLLAAGADVNMAAHGGYTPLHLAASNGQVGIMKLLLAHGADASAKTEDGKTASNLAVENGHSEVTALLGSP